MRTALKLLLVASLSASPIGCSSRTSNVVVTEPPGSSMILAVFGPNSAPVLHAITLGQGALRLPDPLGHDESLRLEALSYALPLDQFGLSEGIVAQSQSAQGGRALPGGAMVYSTTVTASGFSGWTLTATMSAALARVRIPAAADACQRFTPRLTEIAADDHALFAAPIDQDSALLGTGDGKLFRFHRTAWVENEHPGAAMSAGAAIANGEVWLASAAGALWRASLESTVITYSAVTASSASGQTPSWIAGGHTSTGVEIYTMSEQGAVDRWDGVSSRTVYDFGAPSPIGALLWNGPGAVLAIRSTEPKLLRIEAGVARLEDLGFPSTVPAGLARVEGLGNVICGAPGDLLADGGQPLGRWHSIGNSGLLGGPCPMVAVGNGFLYGGDQGLLGQWTADSSCRLEMLGAPAQVQVMSPLGADLVLMAGAKPDPAAMLPVTTISRVTAPGS